MKRFIIISTLVVFFAGNLMSQQKENSRLPWDTIPLLLPPFNIERIDTLRFNPGDTIPSPIWQEFLKKNEITEKKTLMEPLDNMPVIVPPDHDFYMIITKPDTTFHYHMRNLMDENKISRSSERSAIPKRKIK